MNEIDAETDPSLKLLTDALRAGPGSPEWDAAVSRLRRDGMGGDEHAAIVAVREQLERGKSYRSVRAGPGFTRTLMGRLDDEVEGRRRALPMATIMAVVGAVGVAGVVIGLVALLSRGGDVGAAAAAEAGRLRGARLERVVVSASFDGRVPAGWATIGPAKLDARSGLRPAATRPAERHAAAGVVTAEPTPAGEPAAAEALVRPPADADAGTIVQVFVTDAPDAAAALAAGRPVREFAWVLQGGASRVVMPDGRFAGEAVPFPAGPDGALVRVAVSPAGAVVTAAGRELYAGPHGLSTVGPRSFGVRFLTRGGKQTDAAVLSARVVR